MYPWQQVYNYLIINTNNDMLPRQHLEQNTCENFVHNLQAFMLDVMKKCIFELAHSKKAQNKLLFCSSVTTIVISILTSSCSCYTLLCVLHTGYIYIYFIL